MPESLERLLREVPTDPMPARLPARVQQRLAGVRAAERRRRWLLDAALAAVTLGGVVLLWPQLVQIGAQASGGSPASAEVWLARAATAPAQTVLETLTAAIEWTGRLTDNLGIAGLAGGILLTIPLFAWLHRLMPEMEEGALA